MVVPPPLADLRHPADRWQTVFASTLPLAKKSLQNANRCGIQATVSRQADQFPPVERGFFATPYGKKHGAPILWQPTGTSVRGYAAIDKPQCLPRKHREEFNVR
jgi:hypothetical protein